MEYGVIAAVGADNISLHRGGVIIIRAMGRENPRPGGDQAAERSNDDRAAGEQGTFLDDVKRRIEEGFTRGKDVHADIKRIGINGQRWVIGELVGVGVRRRADEIVAELEEGPGGSALN